MSSLYGKYKFSRVDGSSFSKGATVEFSANDDGSVRLEAKVANTLSGHLKRDSNNTLTGMLISTRMAGSRSQMKAEYALANGFEEGMTYTKEGGVLTLKSASHTIVLRAA